MKEHLANWRALCKFIRTANEADCADLLELERKGAARPGFLKRIHGRLNKMRRLRESEELLNPKKRRGKNAQ